MRLLFILILIACFTSLIYCIKGAKWRALVFSIFVAVFNYLFINFSFPFPGENIILQYLYKASEILEHNTHEIPDSILLVNVCYDKQLIDKVEDETVVGKKPITDRTKLLEFLKKAKNTNYRYILLDIFFGEGDNSTQAVDDSLFQLISEMPRIVVANHYGIQLQDTLRLLSKSGNADYSVTWKETDFSRYQFIHYDKSKPNKGLPSISLKMYEELTGDSLKYLWPIYYSKTGGLCYNALVLPLAVKLNTLPTKHKEKLDILEYVYLGSQLLDVDAIIPIKEQIENKIVAIGDFRNDVHDTYAGPQPGTLICLNAYIALQHGMHKVNPMMSLFIFCFYFLFSYLIFKPSKDSNFLSAIKGHIYHIVDRKNKTKFGKFIIRIFTILRSFRRWALYRRNVLANQNNKAWKDKMNYFALSIIVLTIHVFNKVVKYIIGISFILIMLSLVLYWMSDCTFIYNPVLPTFMFSCLWLLEKK